MARHVVRHIVYAACYAWVVGLSGCADDISAKEGRLVYLTDGSPGEISDINAASVVSLQKEGILAHGLRKAAKRGDWQALWDGVSQGGEGMATVYAHRMSRDEWIKFSFARPVLVVDAVEFADDNTLLIDVRTESQKPVNRLRYAVNLEDRAVLYAIPYVEDLSGHGSARETK